MIIAALVALLVATLLLALWCKHMSASVADLDTKISEVEVTVAGLPAVIQAKVDAAVAAALANAPQPDLTAEVARIDAIDTALKQAVA